MFRFCVGRLDSHTFDRDGEPSAQKWDEGHALHNDDRRKQTTLGIINRVLIIPDVYWLQRGFRFLYRAKQRNIVSVGHNDWRYQHISTFTSLPNTVGWTECSTIPASCEAVRWMDCQ